MKAMVVRQQRSIDDRPLELADLPEVTPGPDEVLVRVSACAVCHTDLHVVEGDLPPIKLPIVPGHQIVGVVEQVGPGAANVRVGDRVGIPWLRQTCGRCRFCARGLENLCEVAEFTGYHADGGYAEYTIAPADFVYPLPASFPDEAAAPLLCAGVIGFRALRLCEVRPGERLGLYGFGASAHLVLQVARHWGCDVYVFTRSEEHRLHARELGAAWAGGAEGQAVPEIDAGIIFAPAGWLVPLALAALRPAGTLALAGIHMSPIPELDYRLLYRERTLRSVANLTRQDVREFLDLATEIPIRTEVTPYPLERANEALQALKRGDVHGAAVLTIGDS